MFKWSALLPILFAFLTISVHSAEEETNSARLSETLSSAFRHPSFNGDILLYNALCLPLTSEEWEEMKVSIEKIPADSTFTRNMTREQLIAEFALAAGDQETAKRVTLKNFTKQRRFWISRLAWELQDKTLLKSACPETLDQYHLHRQISLVRIRHGAEKVEDFIKALEGQGLDLSSVRLSLVPDSSYIDAYINSLPEDQPGLRFHTYQQLRGTKAAIEFAKTLEPSQIATFNSAQTASLWDTDAKFLKDPEASRALWVQIVENWPESRDFLNETAKSANRYSPVADATFRDWVDIDSATLFEMLKSCPAFEWLDQAHLLSFLRKGIDDPSLHALLIRKATVKLTYQTSSRKPLGALRRWLKQNEEQAAGSLAWDTVNTTAASIRDLSHERQREFVDSNPVLKELPTHLRLLIHFLTDDSQRVSEFGKKAVIGANNANAFAEFLERILPFLERSTSGNNGYGITLDVIEPHFARLVALSPEKYEPLRRSYATRFLDPSFGLIDKPRKTAPEKAARLTGVRHFRSFLASAILFDLKPANPVNDLRLDNHNTLETALRASRSGRANKFLSQFDELMSRETSNRLAVAIWRYQQFSCKLDESPERCREAINSITNPSVARVKLELRLRLEVHAPEAQLPKNIEDVTALAFPHELLRLANQITTLSSRTGNPSLRARFKQVSDSLYERNRALDNFDKVNMSTFRKPPIDVVVAEAYLDSCLVATKLSPWAATMLKKEDLAPYLRSMNEAKKLRDWVRKRAKPEKNLSPRERIDHYLFLDTCSGHDLPDEAIPVELNGTPIPESFAYRDFLYDGYRYQYEHDGIIAILMTQLPEEPAWVSNRFNSDEFQELFFEDHDIKLLPVANQLLNLGLPFHQGLQSMLSRSDKLSDAARKKFAETFITWVDQGLIKMAAYSSSSYPLNAQLAELIKTAQQKVVIYESFIEWANAHLEAKQQKGQVYLHDIARYLITFEQLYGPDWRLLVARESSLHRYICLIDLSENPGPDTLKAVHKEWESEESLEADPLAMLMSSFYHGELKENDFFAQSYRNQYHNSPKSYSSTREAYSQLSQALKGQDSSAFLHSFADWFRLAKAEDPERLIAQLRYQFSTSESHHRWIINGSNDEIWNDLIAHLEQAQEGPKFEKSHLQLQFILAAYYYPEQGALDRVHPLLRQICKSIIRQSSPAKTKEMLTPSHHSTKETITALTVLCKRARISEIDPALDHLRGFFAKYDANDHLNWGAFLDSENFQLKVKIETGEAKVTSAHATLGFDPISGTRQLYWSLLNYQSYPLHKRGNLEEIITVRPNASMTSPIIIKLLASEDQRPFKEVAEFETLEFQGKIALPERAERLRIIAIDPEDSETFFSEEIEVIPFTPDTPFKLSLDPSTRGLSDAFGGLVTWNFAGQGVSLPVVGAFKREIGRIAVTPEQGLSLSAWIPKTKLGFHSYEPRLKLLDSSGKVLREIRLVSEGATNWSVEGWTFVEWHLDRLPSGSAEAILEANYRKDAGFLGFDPDSHLIIGNPKLAAMRKKRIPERAGINPLKMFAIGKQSVFSPANGGKLFTLDMINRHIEIRMNSLTDEANNSVVPMLDSISPRQLHGVVGSRLFFSSDKNNLWELDLDAPRGNRFRLLMNFGSQMPKLRISKDGQQVLVIHEGKRGFTSRVVVFEKPETGFLVSSAMIDEVPQGSLEISEFPEQKAWAIHSRENVFALFVKQDNEWITTTNPKQDQLVPLIKDGKLDPTEPTWESCLDSIRSGAAAAKLAGLRPNGSPLQKAWWLEGGQKLFAVDTAGEGFLITPSLLEPTP